MKKKQREKIVGYVVLDTDRRPLHIEVRKGFPKEHGTLWRGSAATIFPTRKSANNTIANSAGYAYEQGLPWADDTALWKIMPVKAVVAAKTSTRRQVPLCL